MGSSNKHKSAMEEWGKQFSIKCQIEYNQNPKLCKQCNTPIPYKKRTTNKFCSHSCSASYSNSKRRLKPIRKCLYCGAELVGRSSTKYCNAKCQHKYKRNQVRMDWYSNGNYPGWSSIKSILFEDRGKKCEVCGISSWNGNTLSLEIDHIDGCYTNNNPDNLRIICPNCHSQTNTYKSKNRGNGRPSRRLK